VQGDSQKWQILGIPVLNQDLSQIVNMVNTIIATPSY
jgi:hypothetical protein